MVLKSQKMDFANFIFSIPEDKLHYRYAEGKWTIKQIAGHVLDTERIMAFRALAFSRGDRQPIPGFNEESYVNKAGFNQRKIKNLISEFKKTRDSNIALINSFTPQMIDRKGSANDLVISVRALIYILAGHVQHHMNIINERYL